MRVEPDGNVPNDLAIFGEAPGYEEQMEGKGFVGKSGQQLWADMRRVCGLQREDWYVSNICKEGKPGNRDPKPSEIAAGLPEFVAELDRVQPRVVVTAGSVATRVLLDLPMSDVHGIPHQIEVAGSSFVLMPIYHPAAGLHNKGALAAFDYDLHQLRRLLEDENIIEEKEGRGASGNSVRRHRHLRVRESTPDHLAGCSAWLQRPPDRRESRRLGSKGESQSALYVSRGGVVAVDTEGWPDCPWGVSFSYDGVRGWVIRAGNTATLAWFAKWIADKTVVMHNGIHDLPVLRAMDIHIGDFHDTQVLAYHDMLRTGSGILEAEAQNLGTLAFRELDIRLGELSNIEGVDFANRFIPSSEAAMQYAGADPVATFRLFHVYEDRGLVQHPCYQIDMGQVALVEQMIATGIPFDEEKTLDLFVDVSEKREAVIAELQAMAKKWGNRQFNPGSHPQVRDIVTKRLGLRVRKRTKGGLASTNAKALAEHVDHPFVEKMQLYRELDKLRGTYIKPLLEALQ